MSTSTLLPQCVSYTACSPTRVASLHAAKSDSHKVAVEAVAALANLAVDDANELSIAGQGGLAVRIALSLSLSLYLGRVVLNIIISP